MKKIRILLIFIYILAIHLLVQTATALSPYTVLQISQTASNAQIDRQYRRMRSKNRNSRARKQMMKRAYNQILFQRQFKTNQEVQIPPPQSSFNKPITTHIDQTYVYGYTLPLQFDDGSYFKSHFNETQFILEKMNNSQANKKIARGLLFFGGLLLKIAPCILLFCLCRNRARGGQGFGIEQAILRARAGYANVGRRGARRL